MRVIDHHSKQATWTSSKVRYLVAVPGVRRCFLTTLLGATSGSYCPGTNLLYGNQTNGLSKQLESLKGRKTKQTGRVIDNHSKRATWTSSKVRYLAVVPGVRRCFLTTLLGATSGSCCPGTNRLYGNQTNGLSKQLKNLIRRRQNERVVSTCICFASTIAANEQLGRVQKFDTWWLSPACGDVFLRRF